MFHVDITTEDQRLIATEVFTTDGNFIERLLNPAEFKNYMILTLIDSYTGKMHRCGPLKFDLVGLLISAMLDKEGCTDHIQQEQKIIIGECLKDAPDECYPLPERLNF